MLPSNYQWLQREPGPKMLLEALQLYGTLEVVGAKHNPRILGWAKELGLEKLYNADEIPWCGLAMAICAHRAGKMIPMKGWDILRALQWENFGVGVTTPKLGDILIFGRTGGGHVGMYVGEDKVAYHVLGGNQSNGFNIMRLEKSRLHRARRPVYQNQPANVRVVLLDAKGAALSTNEA